MTHDEKSYQEERALAAVFDDLCQKQDPKHLNHVIPEHQARAASFEWFVKGVRYGRATSAKAD